MRKRVDRHPFAGRTMLIVGAALVLALLGGCAADGQATSAKQPGVTPTATPESCLTGMPVTPVSVHGIDVQVVGSADRAVVISNQSGASLCQWHDLALALEAAGFTVALYDNLGAPDQNALWILSYLRAQGHRSVALLGGSVGAMGSIMAAAKAKPQPEALVSLSAESYQSGEKVADYAAKFTCPSLFVTADNDPDGSTEATAEFKKVTDPANSTFIIVPGRDHGVDLLTLGDIQKTVIAFLDEHLHAT